MPAGLLLTKIFSKPPPSTSTKIFILERQINNIVDQLCTRLEDSKGRERTRQGGMRLYSLEETEAERRYYAAFPALKKSEESPLQYFLPPPAWCHKSKSENKMQSEQLSSREHSQVKNKRSFGGRRNSYQGQRKGGRRRHNNSRSLDNKESLPEWVTDGAEWDMELHAAPAPRPWDWLTAHDLEPRPLTPEEEELYAQYEAKFDSSIEALWAQPATPDDDYQDLPIDFQDLLSSPSDDLFDASAEKYSLLSLPDSIWSVDGAEPPAGERLYDRAARGAQSAEPASAGLNHSRGSLFRAPQPGPRPPPPPPRPAPPPGPVIEDYLTSTETHFRPVRAEEAAAPPPPPRYKDGDTFTIRSDLEEVEFQRSESGGMFLDDGEDGAPRRYLEYRTRSIRYGRLDLTEALRRANDLEDAAFRLRFAVRVCDQGVQTEPAAPPAPPRAAWGPCALCDAARAKKMRPNDIWSGAAVCGGCAAAGAAGAAGGGARLAAAEELARDWDELVSELRASLPAPGPAQARKRRLDGGGGGGGRCARAQCARPHAPLLPCLDDGRPLTR